MISIIIPTLNEEKWLPAALKRFEAIKRPHEVIISDGKSTDRTVEIAKGAGVRVLEHTLPHRQNIAEGRNTGAKAARGNLFVFMDTDASVPQPDKFFDVVEKYLHDNPKVVAVTPRLYVQPDMATWSDKLVYAIFNRWNAFTNNVLQGGAAFGEVQIIRRSAFEKVGGYDQRLIAGEDYDLFSRLSKVGRVRSLDITAYHSGRRVHKVGWPRLLWQWSINYWGAVFFKKSHSKEWKVIR